MLNRCGPLRGAVDSAAHARVLPRAPGSRLRLPRALARSGLQLLRRGAESGQGAAGISQAIAFASCDPGSALINADATFNLATQPVILVENVNCTNAPIFFTATTLPVGNPGAGVGVANWDYSLFNTFCNPATGINNPDTTQYDSLGRYTISQGAEIYTDFHNIAFNKAFKPTITSTANLLGPDTFQVCED